MNQIKIWHRSFDKFGAVSLDLHKTATNPFQIHGLSFQAERLNFRPFDSGRSKIYTIKRLPVKELNLKPKMGIALLTICPTRGPVLRSYLNMGCYAINLCALRQWIVCMCHLLCQAIINSAGIIVMTSQAFRLCTPGGGCGGSPNAHWDNSWVVITVILPWTYYSIFVSPKLDSSCSRLLRLATGDHVHLTSIFFSSELE